MILTSLTALIFASLATRVAHGAQGDKPKAASGPITKAKPVAISYKRFSSKLGWSLDYPSSWEVNAICTGEAGCDLANSDHVTIEAPRGCEKLGKENCGSLDISAGGKFDLSAEERQDNLKVSGYPAFETSAENSVTLEVKGPHTFFLINWNGPANSTYGHVKNSLVVSDNKK